MDGGLGRDDPLARIVESIEHAEAYVPGRGRTARPSDGYAHARGTGQEGVEAPAEEPAGPRAPRRFGFSMEDLNREYSLVLLGAKAVIYVEQPDAPLDDQQRILGMEGFNAWFANRFTEVLGNDGKVKSVPWSTAWLRHPDRRSYRGIEFFPDPESAPNTKGYLNLWSGFAVQPKARPGAYSILADHLLQNVCDGDPDLYAWVFGFFAHMVQRPRERLGVALVMRGKMGAGKSKVGEVMGSLFPRHFFLVDDPRYVTGQFNAHMSSCLLLQADEAVWAGDKAAEGRLKGLVTSPIQQIEAKGIDPIRLKNYLRIVMTSNEDWVVPAGKDERRFCVLDVHPRCAQNHLYFQEMDEQLEAGGREALLADLLAFDLSTVNMRQIPRTGALLEQKLRSLDSVESWFFQRLMDGTTTRAGSEWCQEMVKDTLFDDYIAASERIGIKRKAEETQFAMKLRKLLPTLDHAKRTIETGTGIGSGRKWCWLLPALEDCRAAFETAVQQAVDWPQIDA